MTYKVNKQTNTFLSIPWTMNWTEQQLRQLLHLKDIKGWTFVRIAAHFNVSVLQCRKAYHNEKSKAK